MWEFVYPAVRGIKSMLSSCGLVHLTGVFIFGALGALPCVQHNMLTSFYQSHRRWISVSERKVVRKRDGG